METLALDKHYSSTPLYNVALRQPDKTAYLYIFKKWTSYFIGQLHSLVFNIFCAPSSPVNDSFYSTCCFWIKQTSFFFNQNCYFWRKTSSDFYIYFSSLAKLCVTLVVKVRLLSLYVATFGLLLIMYLIFGSEWTTT